MTKKDSVKRYNMLKKTKAHKDLMKTAKMLRDKAEEINEENKPKITITEATPEEHAKYVKALKDAGGDMAVISEDKDGEESAKKLKELLESPGAKSLIAKGKEAEKKRKEHEAAGGSDFGSGFFYPLALFLAHQGDLLKQLSLYREMRGRELRREALTQAAVRRETQVTVEGSPAFLKEALEALDKFPNPRGDDWEMLGQELGKIPGLSDRELFTDARACEMWLYGACDHLQDFNIDLAPTEEIKKLAASVTERAWKWRMPIGMEEADRVTLELAWQIIEDTQRIFFLLDEHLGNKPKISLYK